MKTYAALLVQVRCHNVVAYKKIVLSVSKRDYLSFTVFTYKKQIREKHKNEHEPILLCKLQC